MLKSLHIKNFRLFRDLKIDSLNRVNLIAGPNNSGKTALLEALYLLLGDSGSFMDFPSALRRSFFIDQTRGRARTGAHSFLFPDEFENFWMWLFHQKKLASPIEIEAVSSEGTYVVKLDQQSLGDSGEFSLDHYRDGMLLSSSRVSRGDGASRSSGPASAEFPKFVTFPTNPSSPTEDADYFNQIAAKRGGEKRLVKLLQVVEPRLQELKYLKLGSQPLVYADVGMEDLIPTTQLGQGFTRLLRLFSETLVGKAKIVLIDEIENGIHYSAMSKVWQGIAEIARNEDLQFFATTHSYECIRYAHEAFLSEPTYDLAMHRLERDDAGNVRVVSLDRESLDTSLKLEWEVR
jgi:AAA ATPase-like protein